MMTGVRVDGKWAKSTGFQLSEKRVKLVDNGDSREGVGL